MDKYINFLEEILQAVAENPSSELVYLLLKENIDKLDENLIPILESWATDRLLQIGQLTGYYKLSQKKLKILLN